MFWKKKAKAEIQIEPSPQYRPREEKVQEPVCFGDIHIPTGSDYDELLPNAVSVIFEKKSCSTSILQRSLKIGYSRAARLVDQLDELRIISPYDGAKPRDILVTPEYAKEILQRVVEQGGKEPELDTGWIIKDEQEWLREQRGLSTVENELYQIDLMEGHAFEYWCAERLKHAGYVKITVTPGSNDQGVDVLAEKDGVKYAIQCKCYSADLGNTPIQEVNAGKAFYRCHVGAVMTNRHFTSGAKDLAEATGTLLWDRDYIKGLIEKEYGSGV